MPHPVPIIIGTTLAVIGTGYAFKKFIYDPHLAPFIDALIEQHRENQQRRRGVYGQHTHTHAYEPIPVPVPAPCGSLGSGRSSAVDSGELRVSRRRRPAEMYELDDTRLLPDDRDKEPFYSPPPARESRQVNTQQQQQQQPQPQQPMQRQPPPPPAPRQFAYKPREVRRPAPAPRQRLMAQRPGPVVVQPTPRRLPQPAILINMGTEAAAHVPHVPLAPSPLAHDLTPFLPRPAEAGSTATLSQPLAAASANATAAPAVAPAIAPALSATLQMPSPPMSPAPASPAAWPTPVSVRSRASPALSNFSHVSHVSSPSIADMDLDIISNASESYVDAETYTPRSGTPLSRALSPASRTMSPPVHIDAAALLAHPLSVENLTLASLGFMNTRASPAPVQSPSASSRAALSTSSWGDEDWRAGASAASDSEWDALSDAGAML